jgi:N6-L-threonylcarbamoyladenine synthase
MSFKDAAFMGIMRRAVYSRLKEMYPNVKLTYGYITKNIRIEHGLRKEHYVDARCISGHPDAEPLGYVFYQKKIRRHNRQIHKCKINKGGYRKLNQASYLVKGFRLFDKVLYKGRECFIYGRRSTGAMDIRLLDGTHVSSSVTCRKLKLIESRKGYLTERRLEILTMPGG